MADPKSKRPARSSKGRDDELVAITLRLSPQELEACRAKADAVGMNTTAWLRIQIRRATGLPTV